MPSNNLKVNIFTELTDLERFCLDAYHHSDLSKSERLAMAYRLSRSPSDLAKSSRLPFDKQADKWIKSLPCVAYLNSKLPKTKISISDNDTTVSKDELLSTFSKAFRVEKDPKTKMELGMKIAELERFKQMDIKAEKDPIEYYVPMKCYKCPLYLKESEDKMLLAD